MEQKSWPTKGILVHGLPRECEREALGIFAGLSLRCHSQDELGLRIIFEHYDCARKTILWQKVMVRGQSYDIYPLVTNVTIHGIANYANKMEIERLMEPYGPVINLYVVNSMEEHTRHKTVSMTDNYRVILDVPEVQAGYRLNPVVLPSTLLEFPISFFCRLCRRDGHKQSQCQAGDVAAPERRGSHERCPKVTWTERGGAEVDLPDQTHPRESPPGIPSGWPISESSRHHGNSIPKKVGMRQKYIDHRDPPSHQKGYATVSSRSTASQSCHRSKNAWQESSERPQICHPENLYVDCKNFPQSTPKSAPSASFIHSIPSPHELHPRKMHRGASKDIRVPKKKDEIKRGRENAENSKRVESLQQRDRARCKNNSTISKSREQPGNPAKDSTDAKVDRPGCQSRLPNVSHGLTQDAPSQPKCYNAAKMESKPVEGDNARRTEGSSREEPMSKKQRRGIRLTVLAPPNTNPSRVMELIRVASSYDARNLPPDVEVELTALLDWNNGPGRSELNEKEATLVRRLEHFLAKVRSARTDEPVADAIPKEEGPMKEGGDPPSPKKKMARCRRTHISQGVLGIMKEVQGELNPVHLENFLKQVRGRRKAVDMARHFTPNIPGLIDQLREVERSYYVSGKRGGEEDVDIRYIRGLYLRLEQDLTPHTKNESGLVIKQEPA